MGTSTKRFTSSRRPTSQAWWGCQARTTKGRKRGGRSSEVCELNYALRNILFFGAIDRFTRTQISDLSTVQFPSRRPPTNPPQRRTEFWLCTAGFSLLFDASDSARAPTRQSPVFLSLRRPMNSWTRVTPYCGLSATSLILWTRLPGLDRGSLWSSSRHRLDETPTYHDASPIWTKLLEMQTRWFFCHHH